MGDEILGLPSPQPLDPNAIRSRVHQLSEIQRNCNDVSELSPSEEEELVRDCVFHLQEYATKILSDYSKLEDLDAYLEHLEGQLLIVEAESAKITDEIENLMRGDLEAGLSRGDGLTIREPMEDKNEKMVNVKFPQQGEDEAEKAVVPEAPPQVPQPKELILSCPICMGKMVEETSTKCGHMFSKGCIADALAAQRKCPTCRRKLRVTDTFRIYLPTASEERNHLSLVCCRRNLASLIKALDLNLVSIRFPLFLVGSG